MQKISPNRTDSKELITPATCTKLDVSYNVESLDSRETLLLHSLLKFYKKKNTLSNVIPIIKQESQISLRIIEWVVTIFAKEQDIIFPIISRRTNKIKDSVRIYDSYKKTLKSFGGKSFGIFKRSDPIVITYGDGEDASIETTLGQLNFFRWALENNIINYIETNFTYLAKQLYKSDRKYKKYNKKSESVKTKITKKKEDEEEIEIELEWEN